MRFSRRGIRPKIAAAKPLMSDIAIATIESLNFDARGVARVGGKTTFIEGALPGEEVRFRYHNKHKTYDTGAVLEVLRQSPARAVPPCRHFGVCGGCSLQHLEPDAQVRAKQQVVAENLERIGHVRPDTWLAPLTGSPWNYRRRARLGARFVTKKGGTIVGFREKRRAYITPLATCLTLDARAAALLPALRDTIGGLARPERLPQIEIAAGDDEIAFVFRHLDLLTDADRERLCAFGQEHRVQIHLQPAGIDSIHALWPRVPSPLTYRLPEFDIALAFQPVDFVQVNGEVNRKMVRQAVELLEVGPNDHVLDLFCGLGNFTLPLARRAALVVGVESDAGLLARAQANADMNGLTNVRFNAEDLYRDSGLSYWQGGRFDKLLLDPPRAGAIEAIKRLPGEWPARIVYVSCYPATLARDSDYLVHTLGYRLAAAGVADMFPQTSHIEAMALFVKA